MDTNKHNEDEVQVDAMPELVSTETKVDVEPTQLKGVGDGSNVSTDVDSSKEESVVAPAETKPEEVPVEKNPLEGVNTDGVDMDALKRAVAMPDGIERDDAIAALSSTGKIKFGDLLKAKKLVEEELDPKKVADREKKDRLERNLVGLANMVGALGNFYNASKGDNGRSVSVANLVEAEAKKQASEKAAREGRMKDYRTAQNDYTKYVSDLFTNANKNYRERIAKEAALLEKKREADEKIRYQYEQLKAKNEYNKEKNEIYSRVAESIINKNNAAAKALLARANASNASATKTKNDLFVSIPYNEGKSKFIIPKNLWNASTISSAFHKLSPTAQEDAVKIINYKIQEAEHTTRNQDLVTKWDQPYITISNVNEKWITANKDIMMEVIGFYLDSKDGEDMLEYLSNLAGEEYKKSSTNDNKDDDEYGIDFSTKQESSDEEGTTEADDENLFDKK